MRAIIKRLRRDERGVSTVITVMLSLVLIVIIVGNVFLTNYKMNQLDMERTQENLSIAEEGESLKVTNLSPTTVHIVAVWVTNTTTHTRHVADLFLNSGEATNSLLENINLPSGNYTVKAVTEKGNIIVYSSE